MGDNRAEREGGVYPRGFSSQIDWPWPLEKAKNLVQLNYGRALREQDRRQGTIRVYGTNGQCGWHDNALTPGPGVILGRKGQGPLGVEWCDSDFWVIDTAYFITRKSEQIDLRYFYYLVKYIGLNHLKDGTSNPSLSRATFDDLLLPKPPIEIQREIASALSALDDKIELNGRRNETLETIARTIFKSWFVDFDPVRAKVEGRAPYGMDASLAALFASSFEDSRIGKIPKSWQVKSLDQIATFLNGLALQNFPAKSERDFLPVIKIAQLRSGETKGSDHASSEIPVEYVVHDGEVLFSWSGSLEVVVWTGGDGALNQHLFKVTSAEYPKWFFFGWVREHLSSFQAIAAGKATTMGHIQRHHLTEALLPAPPKTIIDSASRIMSPLIELFISNALQSRTLATIRDALLPKLMSGEIRIRHAEKMIEEGESADALASK